MSENKIKTKVFAPCLLSFLLLLASYLIYTVVPVSELANSVEHSGMDAVYLLTASPVAAFISLVLLMVAFIPNKKYLTELLTKKVTICAFLVASLLIVISFIFSVLFVVSQYKIGFTAPFDGTKWESYNVFILVSCIIEFISFVLLTFRMNGIIPKK